MYGEPKRLKVDKGRLKLETTINHYVAGERENNGAVTESDSKLTKVEKVYLRSVGSYVVRCFLSEDFLFMESEMLKRDYDDLERIAYFSTNPVKVDDQGRIPLPPSLSYLDEVIVAPNGSEINIYHPEFAPEPLKGIFGPNYHKENHPKE